MSSGTSGRRSLEPLREKLNTALKKAWAEWGNSARADSNWSDTVRELHSEWWAARIARRKEIDASIAAKAEFEYLYDKPYEDKKKVRVVGPSPSKAFLPIACWVWMRTTN